MTNRSTPTRCQIEGCPKGSVRGYTIDLCAEHRQTVVDDIMATGVGLSRCYWPGCRGYCTANIRMCSTHLTIAAYHAAVNPTIMQRVRLMSGPSAFVPATITPKVALVEKPGVVYFLRIGGFVKIGWTSDLDKRMRGYPPDTTLLAVMPGTRKDENRIHKRFAHLRSHGREWFPLAPQITEYVATVVKDHGPPPAVDYSAKATTRTVGPRLNRYVGGEHRGPGARRVS